MSTVTTPYDFAVELLGHASDVLATTASGVPARVAVVPPVPALDCEQLTVHVPGFSVEGTSPGGLTSAHRTQLGVRMNLVTLMVWVVRCTPVPDQRGNPPSVDRLQASADMLLQDGWSIWNHLSVLVRTGGLFTGKCAALYVDPGTPILSQGGFGGWSLPVRAQIDGYVP